MRYKITTSCSVYYLKMQFGVRFNLLIYKQRHEEVEREQERKVNRLEKQYSEGWMNQHSEQINISIAEDAFIHGSLMGILVVFELQKEKKKTNYPKSIETEYGKSKKKTCLWKSVYML